jgi:hypothetical protein
VPTISSPPLHRISNWEERLNAFLAPYHDREKVGDYECVFFAAGAVQAQTGADLTGGFDGQLENEEDVRRVLADNGVTTLAGLVDAKLPRKSRSMAQRGDIVMTRDGNLAVAWGEYALALGLPNAPGREPLPGNGIVVRVPRTQWRKAWAVG